MTDAAHATGGYNEVALGDCVTEHVKAMAMHKSKSSTPASPPPPPPPPKAQLFAPKTQLNAKAVLVEHPIPLKPVLVQQPAVATNDKLLLPEAKHPNAPIRLNSDDSVVMEQQDQLEDEVAQFREVKQRELEEAVLAFRQMRQTQLREAKQQEQQMAPPNRSNEALHRHCSIGEHEAQQMPKKMPREEIALGVLDEQFIEHIILQMNKQRTRKN